MFDLFRRTPCECGCDKLRDELREVKSEAAHARRQLELEWESTYNKIRSILARMNKRQERVDAETLEGSDNGHSVARLDTRAPNFPTAQPAPAFSPVPRRRGNY